MDANFLDYYNRELAYLQELGAEFATAFPKVAGHLGMQQGGPVADPYVERLLEGFAFLSSRIHLKMDAEFPRFSQHLLEVVFPHYLAPTPAMAIVQIPLDPEARARKDSVACLPRGTLLNSPVPTGAKTPCTFATAQDMEAWPLDITAASAGLPAGDLPAARFLHGKTAKGEIRLRLKYLVPGGTERLHPERLVFFLAASDALATKVFEELIGHCLAVGVSATGTSRAGGPLFLPADAVRAEGFGGDQALLPGDPRVFQGYRLLHEYFAFPQRFLFFSINGLRAPLARLGKDEFDLTVLLDRDPGSLANSVDKGCFALDCVPVINVFPRHGNRQVLTHAGVEHHIVPDRSRPLDYEVYRIDGAEGFDRGNTPINRFAPFYRHAGVDDGGCQAYFTLRRENRRLSESSQRNGARSSYAGSEVFLSIVDANEAPWSQRIDQLEVSMLLTNRDLPLLIATGGARDLAVDSGIPMSWGHILRGPTRPRYSVAEREMTWRLISHLSLNYLALRDTDAKSGAVALRELLGLYATLADPAVARHGNAIVAVRSSSVTRRLPVSGPLVFGRGIGIEVTVDEVPFAGSSPFLFGCVLEQFLARHVTMNMFCELSLVSATRGPIAAWPPRLGGRPDA
ncbi:MAG: type VI secretion system baseplate subunit TssF [Azoarcus sp.]|jgi:type VI secretion system protein ImpG|nr:type VI secretion system baseplate subunit TssF [Azoarcus sp.]